MTQVFLAGARLQRRIGLVWVLLLTATTAGLMAFWPLLKDSPELMQINGAPPEMLDQLGIENGEFVSGVAYLQSSLFNQSLPLILAVAGVLCAIGLTVWDEENGRLETLLALPVGHRGVYLARFAVAVTMVLGLAVLAWVVLTGLATALDVGVPISGLTAGVVMTTLLALVHAAMGYALAAAGVGKAATISLTGGVLIAGMMLWGLAPLLGPVSWLGRLSPWSWALNGEPLVNGFQPVGVLVLVGICVALTAGGTALLGRRDIRGA